jgi:hypothetical protein
MDIPTLIPETNGGTIQNHVTKMIARMRHENTEEANLLFNGVKVHMFKTSDFRDIIEKWILKDSLVKAGLAQPNE